jgi:hypothetical protein
VQGLGYRQYPRLREEVQSLYRGGHALADPSHRFAGATCGELVTESSEAQRHWRHRHGRVARINQLLKNLPHIMGLGGAIM